MLALIVVVANIAAVVVNAGHVVKMLISQNKRKQRNRRKNKQVSIRNGYNISPLNEIIIISIVISYGPKRIE